MKSSGPKGSRKQDPYLHRSTHRRQIGIDMARRARCVDPLHLAPPPDATPYHSALLLPTAVDETAAALHFAALPHAWPPLPPLPPLLHDLRHPR